ncbi:MAG: FxsA family protein [Planctomycetota bacterium]
MRVSSGMYLVFIAVPLIELALLIQVGSWIGTGPTIGLVVVTAIAGASLARWQGLSAIERARSMANAGQLPAGPVFDGILILAAALLLLTPGILTDVVGFLLLVPFVRRRILVLIRKRIEAAEGPREKAEPAEPPPSSPGGGKVIDQDGNIVG